MPDTEGHVSPTERPPSEMFHHLPDGVVLEDTVLSVLGDVPSEPAGERNAFIDAALQAGGGLGRGATSGLA